MIDHDQDAVSGWRDQGDIPARVGRVFGRQLSIRAADGSRSPVALFYHEGRLYQIEGKSLPTGNATADAIRFQQSLIFTDNGSNGPPGDRRQGRPGRDRADGQRGEGRRGPARAPEVAPEVDASSSAGG